MDQKNGYSGNASYADDPYLGNIAQNQIISKQHLTTWLSTSQTLVMVSFCLYESKIYHVNKKEKRFNKKLRIDKTNF